MNTAAEEPHIPLDDRGLGALSENERGAFTNHSRSCILAALSSASRLGSRAWSTSSIPPR